MFNLGTSEAATALIGNQIGARNVPLARQYAKVIIYLSMAISFLYTLPMFIYREEVSEIFTNEQATKDMVVSIFPILCFFNPTIDAVNSSLKGSVNALGL